MRIRHRAAAFLLAGALLLTACGREPEPDPHEGMEYISIGDYYDWITPAEGQTLSGVRVGYIAI